MSLDDSNNSFEETDLDYEIDPKTLSLEDNLEMVAFEVARLKGLDWPEGNQVMPLQCYQMMEFTGVEAYQIYKDLVYDDFPDYLLIQHRDRPELHPDHTGPYEPVDFYNELVCDHIDTVDPTELLWDAASKEEMQRYYRERIAQAMLTFMFLWAESNYEVARAAFRSEVKKNLITRAVRADLHIPEFIISLTSEERAFYDSECERKKAFEEREAVREETGQNAREINEVVDAEIQGVIEENPDIDPAFAQRKGVVNHNKKAVELADKLEKSTQYSKIHLPLLLKDPAKIDEIINRMLDKVEAIRHTPYAHSKT